MKKLGKLNLKNEKMLSHEELVSFRGGSDAGGCETTTSTCDMCKQGALYDCEYVAFLMPGSLAFAECAQEGLEGCCELAC